MSESIMPTEESTRPTDERIEPTEEEAELIEISANYLNGEFYKCAHGRFAALRKMGGKAVLPKSKEQSTEFYMAGYKCTAQYQKTDEGVYFNVDVQKNTDNMRVTQGKSRLIEFLERDETRLKEEWPCEGLLSTHEVTTNDEHNPTNFQIRIKVNQLTQAQLDEHSTGTTHAIWRRTVVPLWGYLHGEEPYSANRKQPIIINIKHLQPNPTI